MFAMKGAVVRRGSRLLPLTALWLILVGGFFVGGCDEGRSSSNASLVLAATPTPQSKVPVLPEFDSVRIVAEREVADNHGAFASTPAWSPDGSKIAFAKRPAWDINPGWSPWGEVWVADGDGSNPRMIVANGVGVGWSRDGQWLYFSSTEPHEKGREIATTDLYRIRPDGSEETFLFRDGANRGSYPAPCELSDGRVASLTGQGRITFLDPETRRTMGSLPDATASLFWCSPDGRFLAYKAGYQLWIGPSDGSSWQLLGDVSVDETHPVSWTTDGRTLVYSTRYDLLTAEAGGANKRKVADLNSFLGPKAEDYRRAIIGQPLTSPDGRLLFVYYSSGLDDARPSTYLVDVATGRVKVFAEGKMLIALSPAGSKGLLSYSWIDSDGLVRRPLSVATIAP